MVKPIFRKNMLNKKKHFYLNSLRKDTMAPMCSYVLTNCDKVSGLCPCFTSLPKKLNIFITQISGKVFICFFKMLNFYRYGKKVSSCMGGGGLVERLLSSTNNRFINPKKHIFYINPWVTPSCVCNVFDPRCLSVCLPDCLSVRLYVRLYVHC